MRAMAFKDMLRIGCGAGFSGDRWDAAVAVVETLARAGGPAVLMFETLAERTLALAQLQRQGNPDAGWEPSLERFVRPVLARCVAAGIPIVGNFGAANPQGAARRLQALAASLGLGPLRIAVVEGDDLKAALPPQRLAELLPLSLQGRPLVSANAYLGAHEIAGALRAGAQIVVTGRVADPALALGPLLAHFEWPANAWDLLACGTMAGHLLECGAQVTGGYFADPGIKDVPGLAEVGFPIVEFHADGRFVVAKAEGTGGCVNRRTVVEQLLYEVHDPAAYLTPDVVADLTEAQVREVGVDQVAVSGVRGHPRPDNLKVNVFHEGGWLAEAEISYAGAGAERRARLAADILRRRLPGVPVRIDLIGVVSILSDDDGRLLQATAVGDARDVRLRIAGAPPERDEAERICRELTTLYTCGPAGGGGVRAAIRPRLRTMSCFIPRERVATSHRMLAP